VISWLNNTWVVGIGGGILSGLFVTYISRFWLSKRDNKEYRQKITTANQEILYAVRPCISEDVLPTRKVMYRLNGNGRVIEEQEFGRCVLREEPEPYNAVFAPKNERLRPENGYFRDIYSTYSAC
jgi:hypothetical protein